MYAALTFVILYLTLCVQEFIPRLGEQASYGIVLLFPVCFLCMAVTLPYPVMLGLAFFGGLLWDLRHTVDPGLGSAGIPVPGATPFGISILFFGILGSMMHGVRPLYLRKKMFFPVVLTGVGIFLYRLMDYLFLNFRRGDFQLPPLIFKEMGTTALVSMLVSPLIYFVLYWLSRSLNAGPRHAYGRP